MWELPVLFQADNRIFKSYGFVTTYPCNNSTRSPLCLYLFLFATVIYLPVMTAQKHVNA